MFSLTKKIKNKLGYLVGDIDEFSLSDRIYHANLIIMIGIDILLLIQAYTTWTYIRESIIIWLLAGSYYWQLHISRFKRKYQTPLKLVYFFSTYASLTYFWFINQGIEGPLLLFFSIVFLFALTVFRGTLRVSLVSLILATVTVLIAVEYKDPSLVPPYDNREKHFMDMLISYYIVSVFVVATLYLVIMTYDLAHGKIEQRVVQKTKELQAAMELAEKHSKAKSEFIANISHEIRTPMNSIMGAAELILANSADQEILDYTKLQKRAGKHLLSLINDFLDIARIEAGEIKLREAKVNMAVLIRSCYDMLTDKAKIKNIEFGIRRDESVSEYLLTDEARIRQIIINLGSNAIKFTHHGHVYIDLSLENKNDGDTLVIQVTDSGIGIADDDQDEIFRPFHQVDSSYSRQYGGVGMGLAITKRLIDAMHGTLEVHSELGAGSQFTVKVPVEKLGRLTDESSINTASVKPISGTLNILIVDDQEDNHIIHEMYLVDHLIVSAYNGKEALEFYKNGMFDVVLMDIQMPVMDGLTSTREIRKFESESGIAPVPIIAITAHARRGDRGTSIAAGCSEHLTKPISKDKLLETIAEHLAEKKDPETNPEV